MFRSLLWGNEKEKTDIEEGTYSDTDLKIEGVLCMPPFIFKDEIRLFHVPVGRFLATLILILIEWNSISFIHSMCTHTAKNVLAFALTVCSIYYVFALWWDDEDFSYPPTWSYLMKVYKYKAPGFVPWLGLMYETSLMGIALVVVSVTLLLNVWTVRELWQWDC